MHKFLVPPAVMFLVACGSMSEDGKTTSMSAGSSSATTGSGSMTGAGGSATVVGPVTTGSGGAGQGGSGQGSGQGGSVPGGSGPGGSGPSTTASSGGGGGAGGAVGGAGGTGGAGGASGGSAGSSGSGGARDAGAAGGTGSDAGPVGDAGTTNFSFFVTSLGALQMLAGNVNGFGGNLTFGQANGLAGADEICRRTAELGQPGAGRKQWRAFLSASQGPVHARDRIGPGPWYDRNGRLLAMNLTDLFAGPRPRGDAVLVNDMTNERGEPNHRVGPAGYVPTMLFDDHDTLTGSDTMGMLRATGMADTCNDWTSTSVAGRPWAGHSWPRSATNGQQWASDHQVPSCTPGRDVTLGGTGGNCIGCSGGYGGFFCFALP